jgi:hypothetical protein
MHNRKFVVDRHVDIVGRRRERDDVSGGAVAAIDG